MILTPLKIMMLLHYYAIAEPYACRNVEHANSTGVKEQREWLIAHDLLETNTDSGSGYRVTERGKVLVDALCGTALPIREWRMP